MLKPRLASTTSRSPVKSGCASSTRAPSLRSTCVALDATRRISWSTGVTPRSALQAIRAPRRVGRRTAAVNVRPSTGYEIGERGSGPAITESISARSATVRAIGPCTEYASQAVTTG
jgi:hypothetical protein